MSICEWCGELITRQHPSLPQKGPPPRYCGTTCRVAAHRARKRRALQEQWERDQDHTYTCPCCQQRAHIRTMRAPTKRQLTTLARRLKLWRDSQPT